MTRPRQSLILSLLKVLKSKTSRQILFYMHNKNWKNYLENLLWQTTKLEQGDERILSLCVYKSLSKRVKKSLVERARSYEGLRRQQLCNPFRCCGICFHLHNEAKKILVPHFFFFFLLKILENFFQTCRQKNEILCDFFD